jgi:hypothetical protein
MKHIFKKSLLLISLVLCQFIDLNPLFANTANININDSVVLTAPLSSIHESAPFGRISIPDRNMIRKADNEIHRNMKADLAEAKAMMKILRDLTPADLTIHADFFSNFLIKLPINLNEGDDTITANFTAENINSVSNKSLQQADLQINKDFYSIN